jgi:predicted DNA-binding protein (MmcQ/YjbR family)
MRYEWIDEYCLDKKGVEKDFKEEWNATRYMVRGKIFVMLGGDKEGTPIITIKCDPSFGRFLRDEYEDIIPGYHMNKEHWNSIYIGAKVPDEVVKQMTDMSYSIILNSLSKKIQKEILER